MNTKKCPVKILGCCVQGHCEHSKFQLMFVWMIPILLPRNGTLFFFLLSVGCGGCCFAFRTNQGFNRRYFIHVWGESWRFLCRSQDLSSSIHTAEYSNITTTTLPIFSACRRPPLPPPPPPPPWPRHPLSRPTPLNPTPSLPVRGLTVVLAGLQSSRCFSWSLSPSDLIPVQTKVCCCSCSVAASSFRLTCEHNGFAVTRELTVGSKS